MWGFKGFEDLGGGLFVVMNLENGFNLGFGLLDVLFNCFVVVGLLSKMYGMLLLGCVMGIFDGEIWLIDLMGLQNMGVEMLQVNCIWGLCQNVIIYNLLIWGGFLFCVQVGLNGIVGYFNVGRQFVGVMVYQNGLLMFKVFYEEICDINGEFINFYMVFCLFMVGGIYQIGDVKLFGGYSCIQLGGVIVVDVDNLSGVIYQ